MTNVDYERQLNLWVSGVIEEVAYWKHWFKHGVKTNGNWEINLRERLKLQEFEHKALKSLLKYDENNLTVLDIGSGPITRYGSVLRGKPIKLIPIDPLANEYGKLCARFGVEPPVKTVMGFGEYITSYFDSESVDIVIFNNSLDHSFDPVKCLRSAMDILRIGGVLSLFHKKCEAENEKYVGMHQWNIDCERDRFLVWNRSERIDVGALFGAAITVSTMVTTDEEGIDYIDTIIVKKAAYSETIGEIKTDRKFILDQMFHMISLYNKKRVGKRAIADFRYTGLRYVIFRTLAILLPRGVKNFIKRRLGRV